MILSRDGGKRSTEVSKEAISGWSFAVTGEFVIVVSNLVSAKRKKNVRKVNPTREPKPKTCVRLPRPAPPTSRTHARTLKQMPKLSDYGSLVFVTVTHVSMLAVIYYLSVMATIQNNWSEYRCNPMYMLFAKDGVEKNFQYCMQNAHGSIMGTILQPVQMIMSNLSSVGSMNVLNLNNMRDGISGMRSFMEAGLGNFENIFMNLYVVFLQKMAKIQDMFAKIIGIVVTVLNIATAVGDGAKSLANGPIGGFMQFMSGGG